MSLEAVEGPQACDCNTTVVGSIPTLNELLFINILKRAAKAWVELHYLTRNASKIWRKLEYRVS